MDTLWEKLRVSLGRDKSPSIGIIDSRSVMTSQLVSGERGINGNKKVKGRKVLSTTICNLHFIFFHNNFLNPIRHNTHVTKHDNQIPTIIS